MIGLFVHWKNNAIPSFLDIFVVIIRSSQLKFQRVNLHSN